MICLYIIINDDKGQKYRILFIQISSAKYRNVPLEFTIIYGIFERWANL